MFCEGGEGSREVWDEVVRRCGNGYGMHICHDVFFVGREGISEGRKGSSGVYAEGACWSVRLCDSGKCTNEVTSRGVEALDEWCKEGLECSLEL